MIFDDLYRRFDGALPHEEQRATEFGSVEQYAIAFSRIAERNFYRRCLDLVQTISAWRTETRYPGVITQTMLEKLGWGLNQARQSAVQAYLVI